MMRNISECNNEIRDVNRSDNSTNGINENSIQPAKSQSREDQAGEISLYINQALDAYKDDDSTTVTECCNKVLAIDPENEEAWKLLALFGGWDAKLYDFDTGYILRTINHALGLTPENEKYDVAADIYTARKRQISLRLEAAIMMPSYQGAKQTHAVMMDWKRLLAEIPYLTPGLIESEVTLCSNICTRSKMGIMPNDRLVYTAYATFNNKEPYGETFRKVLASRAEKEMQREANTLVSAKKEVEDRLAKYRAQVESGDISAEEEKTLLEEEASALRDRLSNVVGMSNRKLYQQQYEELQSQLANLKPYKFFKRNEINDQLKAVREKLDQIDAQIEAAKSKIQPQIDAIEERIAEISK